MNKPYNAGKFREASAKEIACDKFSHCNAPVCPLDPMHGQARHLKGEKACFYLLEAVKPDAQARFEGAGRGHLYPLLSDILPGIRARHAALWRALERAAMTPSRLGRALFCPNGESAASDGAPEPLASADCIKVTNTRAYGMGYDDDKP